MERRNLFTLDTIYRAAVAVDSISFGSGEKTLAITGPLRGNEVQQLYICSLLVGAIAEYESRGMLSGDGRVIVIPCVNSFSMNLGRRFWAADNTDINGMFPGYGKGETTQRIAYALFERLKGYRYGIVFSSHPMQGSFVPHVRILDTGYQNADAADYFGLPYVMTSRPEPADSGSLDYNWQIFETDAFSIYTKETSAIHDESARRAVRAVLSFMSSIGLVKRHQGKRNRSTHFREGDLVNVLSRKGGIFISKAVAGDAVENGSIMADIIDPYTGGILERVIAPCDGTVFFSHGPNLICGHEVSYRIVQDAG
jgi:predicted deacylase